MRNPALALIPTALLLASCGTADAEPQEPQTVGPPPSPTFEAPEPVSLDEPQSFEYTTMDGAKGVLTIPSEPEPAFHNYLTLTGQSDDKTYAVIDIDNREGMAPYGVYEVNLYTPEGEQITFSNMSNAFADIPIETSGEHLDALYATPDAEEAAVGQRTDAYVVTGQELPAEVSRIEVGQTGGGSVEVYPGVPEGAIQ